MSELKRDEFPMDTVEETKFVTTDPQSPSPHA